MFLLSISSQATIQFYALLPIVTRRASTVGNNQRTPQPLPGNGHQTQRGLSLSHFQPHLTGYLPRLLPSLASYHIALKHLQFFVFQPALPFILSTISSNHDHSNIPHSPSHSPTTQHPLLANHKMSYQKAAETMQNLAGPGTYHSTPHHIASHQTTSLPRPSTLKTQFTTPYPHTHPHTHPHI